MAENMPIVAEGWVVAADRVGLWLVSGGDAWRTAPVPSDSGPHAELELELSAHGIDLDRVALMHSTSWRADGPHLIVTYMVVVTPDDLVRGIWRDARPITAEAADEVGTPRTHAADEPPEPSDFHVLMHGLRHLKFLTENDGTAAAALGGLWREHLGPFGPALAGMYSEPHRAA
jgi:hypothetical protein